MANISPPVAGYPVVDPNVFTPQRDSGPKVPYLLAQSAVPVILPSSGTSNATGQITLTTALPYQPSGTVQIYLPSGVVTAGSAGTGAGLYSVVFSSTTVAQIQGTGIVTANGAYTQTTASDLTLATVTVPGGAMGANGSVRAATVNSLPNNANGKTLKASLGALGLWNVTPTTNSVFGFSRQLRNRGSQSSQVQLPSGFSSDSGGSATAMSYGSIDTSVNQNLTFTGQLAVATDYIILEGHTVEVLPG